MTNIQSYKYNSIKMFENVIFKPKVFIKKIDLKKSRAHRALKNYTIIV